MREFLDKDGGREAVIRTPFDDSSFDEAAPPKKVLAPPPWVWAFGLLLERGWQAEVEVVHLLGVCKSWTPDNLGFLHSGRLCDCFRSLFFVCFPCVP